MVRAYGMYGKYPTPFRFTGWFNGNSYSLTCQRLMHSGRGGALRACCRICRHSPVIDPLPAGAKGAAARPHGSGQTAAASRERIGGHPPYSTLHPPPSSSQVQQELLLARMEADGQRQRAERSERAAEGAAAGGQLVALSRLHQSEMEGASAAAAAREAALEVRKGGQCCSSSTKAGGASRGEGRAVAGAAGGQLRALSRLGSSFPHPANPLCMAAPAPSLHWTAVNTWRPTCMAISHNFASPVMIP